MSKKEKLLKRLKSKPRDFTFAELKTIMLSYGFVLSNKGRTSGSAVMFMRGNIRLWIH